MSDMGMEVVLPPTDLAISVRVKPTRWDGEVEHHQQGQLVSLPTNAVVGPGVAKGELQASYGLNPSGIVIRLTEPGSGLPVFQSFIVLDRPADPNTDAVELSFGVHPVNFPSEPVLGPEDHL